MVVFSRIKFNSSVTPGTLSRAFITTDVATALRSFRFGKIILIDTRDAWPEPSYLQPAGKTLRRLGGCGAQTVAVGFAA